MKEMSIQKLAKVINASEIGSGDNSITRITTDSRMIKPGDCFFAIKGQNFDGHDYLKEAFAAGAACAVVSEAKALDDKMLLKVDDTIEALGVLARYWREKMGFEVVAVTGSAGKTTTKNMIFHIISKYRRCHQSPKSFNNNIGVPLTLLGAEPDIEIVIAEIGSNHPGEIAPLSKIAAPDIALITNIYPTHMEGFGSIEAIIKEKTSIADGLKSGGKFLINGDFENLCQYCRENGIEFDTFGKNKSCSIHPEQISNSGGENILVIEGTEVIVPLAGRANVENAIAAWGICRKFSISAGQFANAMGTMRPLEMRLELLEIGPVSVINDCYNANPASMANALDYMSSIAGGRRRLFICGQMAELGDKSEEYHSDLGRKIAEAGVDTLLAVGAYAEIVAEAAQAATKTPLRSECLENTAQLCDNIHNYVQADDIILVKASRTAGFECVAEKLEKLFAPDS